MDARTAGESLMLGVEDVAAAVAELAPRIDGGQVQKIREPRADTVVLSIRRPGETVHLVLSCAPRASRIARAEGAGPTLPEPTTLGRWLRASLRGRRVATLRQLGGDRVVELAWEGGRLVAELTGRHANLFGLTGDRIAAVSRPPSRGSRDLRPSRDWRPPDGSPRMGERRFESARAIEKEAQARLTRDVSEHDEAARRRLLQEVRRRLERLRKNVAADVARCEDADAYRRAGELLKSEVHRLRRGMTSVEVTDWYAPGTPQVEVPLDPKLDGQGNVARLFGRYRRAQSGAARAAERLAAVEAQLATLSRLADAPELESALRDAGLLRTRQRRPKRGREAPRQPYREFRSARGERILVGRGGSDNHALTFRHARGNDHWLHVRDAPGAHVVVLGAAPHPETLLDAAALAAHHSDLRGEPVVDVTHTLRKHVRAVKGAPGRVTIASAKTLTVTDGRARVDRLHADARGERSRS